MYLQEVDSHQFAFEISQGLDIFKAQDPNPLRILDENPIHVKYITLGQNIGLSTITHGHGM